MSDPQPTTPLFDVHRVYIKDVSFESPQSPQVFARAEFKPKVDVQLQVSSSTIPDGENLYEVVVTATVSAIANEQTAFLVEIQQAGIFLVGGFEPEQLELMLEVACPNALFPYLRESVSDFVSKGGFPQLLLSPVNFEAMYRRRKAEMAEAGSESAGETAH